MTDDRNVPADDDGLGRLFLAHYARETILRRITMGTVITGEEVKARRYTGDALNPHLILTKCFSGWPQFSSTCTKKSKKV